MIDKTDNRTTITECHRLGSLNNKYFFSPFWKLEVRDQGTSTIRFLVKALPGLHVSPHYTLTWQSKKRSSLSCLFV